MGSSAHLEQLSSLLDAVLDLPESDRVAWVDAHPDLSGEMRRQLKALLETGSHAFTLPPLPAYTDTDCYAQAEDLRAEDQVGPYRLIREIGRGGMGSVWLTERIDGAFKRQVALKLPHSSLPYRQLAERFARERDILASLEHPHIARLYDAGVTPEGRSYLALEYVEGRSLLEYCQAERLGLNQRLKLFLQVLGAVQFAHSRLVVHRDLKPSNILITAEGYVRLLDFGIAKFLDEETSARTQLTEIGGKLLTPQYASPEQILGQPIGTSADVYSLGVLLYELLAGALPYRLKRETRGALEESILDVDPPLASETASGNTETLAWSRSLRGDLDTILAKALKKNPAERYATAAAFGDDLNRYLSGDAVLAQPDSLAYRARKFVGRHRWAVLAGVIVFLSLSGGLGAALWQAQIAEEHAEAARKEAKTSKAVQDFLRGIFIANTAQQADPFKARQTTTRELLDIGVEKIEQELEETPEAKLTVLFMFIEIYSQMLLYEKATELAQRQLDLVRKTSGPDSLAVVEALMPFALTLRGRWIDDPRQWNAIQEAMAIMNRRDPGMRETWHQSVLLTMFSEYQTDRDFSLALNATRQAMAIYHGDDDYTLNSLRTARAELLAGNAKEAFEAAELGLLAGRRMNTATASAGKVGDGSFIWEPALLESMGRAKVLQNDLPAAKKYLRQALAAALHTFGEEDPETAGLQARLGAFLATDGLPAQAGEARTLVQQAAATLGPPKPDDRSKHRYFAYALLGKAQLAVQQPHEALVTLTAALAMRDPAIDASPAIAEVLRDQVRALLRLGNKEEARKVFDRAVAMREKSGIKPSVILDEEAEIRRLL